MNNLFSLVFDPDAGHAFLDDVQTELFELRMITQQDNDSMHAAFNARITTSFDGPSAAQALVRDGVYNLYADDPKYQEMTGEALADALLAPLDLDLEAAREALQKRAAPPAVRGEPFDIVVPVAEYAWMWNRNGTRPIREVLIRYTGDGPCDLFIQGVRMNGAVLKNGGMRINAAAFDKVAEQWLAKRRSILPAPGSFLASIDLGGFSGSDPATVAKDVYAYLDSKASLSELVICLLDSDGITHEVDLSQFEIEDLFNHVDGD